MKKEKISDAVEILKRRYIKNDPVIEASIEEERINSDVAQMIYALRKEKDMTQAELAKTINTTQSVISRLEDSDYNGHSLSMLQKICIALGRKMYIAIVKDELNYKELEAELNYKEQENQLLKKEIQDMKVVFTEMLKTKIEITVNNEGKKEISEQQLSSTSDENIIGNYNEVAHEKNYLH